MPAGPVGVYVSSLYCEAAILCHVEQLHRLGLTDQQLAAHLMTLWHLMPDFESAQAAIAGTGPSVITHHTSRAGDAFTDLRADGAGHLSKSDALTLVWRLRKGGRQGLRDSIDATPGSLSPKDVLLPKSRVKEVFARAEQQLGIA